MGFIIEFISNLKNRFKVLSILDKYIVINVFIFFLGFILKLWFKNPFYFFQLPSDPIEFITQPWSIISYAFLHYDVLHIFLNMIWLYFIGQYFLNLFSGRLAVNVYLLGAISGGLLYLLTYTLFPSFFGVNARLVGASAAVRALMIFLCAYMPRTEIRVFTFNIKLGYIGLALVGLDVIGLFGSNSGGNVAHLGGAALGYFYAIQYKDGIDIGKGFGIILDWMAKLISYKSKPSSLKTVHKTKKKNAKVAGYSKEEFNSFTTQKRIDIILDKISKSGYDSLTAEEKEFLFKSGKQ